MVDGGGVGVGVVEGDINGDGMADFQIALNGVSVLVAKILLRDVHRLSQVV